MRNPTITRAAYLAAFETWFRVCEENGTAQYGPGFPDHWRGVVALATLPEEAPVDEFCKAIHAVDPSLYRCLFKSSFLERALYLQEPLRTVKCPEHKGRWMGLDFGPTTSMHCTHGCHLTGWLPAAHVAAKEVAVVEGVARD